MPNWCSNVLNICGPVASIDKFMDDITTGPKESDGTTSGMGNDYEILENLFPCPEDLKNVTSRFGTIGDDDPEKEQKQKNIEDHGAVDWYEWCCTNWGNNFHARVSIGAPKAYHRVLKICTRVSKKQCACTKI